MTLDAIGWIAVVLTQVFYIPNTVRILRTRDVRGYSLFGWLLLFLGLVCFLVYFTAHGDPVGIVANVCGVTGSGSTAFCIWLWRGRDPVSEVLSQGAQGAIGRAP
ncbi:MAG: hypothetical protein HS107_13130 [Thermoflexaceae bacterium]|nr:hypothetical protein [Thermoflexaceae bacterium]